MANYEVNKSFDELAEDFGVRVVEHTSEYFDNFFDFDETVK